MKVFRNVMILMLIVVLILAISFVIFSYLTLNNDNIPIEELTHHQYYSINNDYALSIYSESAIYKTPDTTLVFDDYLYSENFLQLTEDETTYNFIVLDKELLFCLESNMYLYVWEIAQ